jgi:GLPGLI family protein
MKKLILIIFLFTLSNINAQNNDSSVYLCKYSFIWQKDSSNKNSKHTDIMHLEIEKELSRYYSYQYQLGIKNLKEDIEAKKDLNYIKASSSKYYPDSESEIIVHYFNTKEFKILDKLTGNGSAYCYSDSIEAPTWKISDDTLRVLDQLCQRATTTFKGRDYVAWFTTGIPISSGPWEFNGLPGLILKIDDTKDQFSFECTELNTVSSAQITDIEYPNCKKIEKTQLRNLQKLKETDRLTFDRMQYPGITITAKTNTGEIVPVPHQLKPYNPIDLSK